MEPVSFAVGVVGLAGLFGSCLEAIDRAKDYKSFETDSQALNAQFEADRLRFERWGRSVGLEVGQLSADHHELLDDDRTVSTVMGLLKFINEVCSLHGASPQVGGDRAMPQSRKAFSSVPPHGIPSTGGGLRRCKLTWAFGGKGEHKSQVELFGRSVQQLHELVPPDQPKGWFPKNGAKAGSSNTSHGINRPNELIRAETQSNNEWLAQIQQLLTEKEGKIDNLQPVLSSLLMLYQPKFDERSTTGWLVTASLMISTMSPATGSCPAHATGYCIKQPSHAGALQTFPRTRLSCCGYLDNPGLGRLFYVRVSSNISPRSLKPPSPTSFSRPTTRAAMTHT